ncbi:MAG: helix-hairpin-helix domain-containing protein [Flavobacteriales bacterium]|nr:helix-hairpin-helix domain-containing protein [Flavobacteriales bacterium]MCB0788288.1 helix-hairpin-helix domain-containing protein [Flavobacteriales bacterium]
MFRSMASRGVDPYRKERLKDLFALHQGERRGTIVLVVLLLGLSVWAFYEQWFKKAPVRDLSAIEKEMQAWIAEQEAQAIDPVAVHRFPFDPNMIGREEWRALGLTDKQVDGIERYMAKGGKFRTKKDLGRMYSLPPEQFLALEPFILLPDSSERRRYTNAPRTTYADRWPRKDTIYERRTHSFTPARKLEVNTADTTALIALPGVGPSFARGIVKYRDWLGGYVSLDQLEEVFVLKDKPDAISRLKELLVVDTLMVRRIPINTCSVEELAAHPYLRWKLAKPLIAYRNQHGPFQKPEDILGCVLIDEALFRKLAPYLSVE